MGKLRLLFLYSSSWNYFAGRSTDHLMREIARQTECKLAGGGFPDYVSPKDRSALDVSREEIEGALRTPPDRKWEWNSGIEAQKSRERTMLKTLLHLYGKDDPDWVIGGFVPSSEISREYKLTRWAADMHVNTDLIARVINADLDFSPQRSLYCTYIFDNLEKFRAIFGTHSNTWVKSGNCRKVEKDYFIKQLTKPHRFFPHCAEPSEFKPVDESQKKYDVSMIASVGNCYPLRKDIKKHLPSLAKKHQWTFLLKQPPNTNYAKYRRDISLVENDPKLREQWLLGADYAKAVAESKVFIFGNSVFRYPVVKIVEGLASQTLVMMDPPFHTEDMHLKSDWNFVAVDQTNWKARLEYYLDDDQLRETVARRGYETAMKHFTTTVRAKAFIDTLEKLT